MLKPYFIYGDLHLAFQTIMKFVFSPNMVVPNCGVNGFRLSLIRLFCRLS